MAKLFFRYGAMNSGKTTALIQVAHNYQERGMRTFLLKPSVDVKGKKCVISRLSVAREVDKLVLPANNLFDLIEQENAKTGDIKCILVDEAQFLTSEQVIQLFKVAVLLDIPVICYGLRTDFQLNGFEGSEQLLLLAHSLEELKTICKCGRKAVANTRKIDGVFIFTGDQVAIEGEKNVEYESLCAQCYYRHKEEAEEQDSTLSQAFG